MGPFGNKREKQEQEAAAKAEADRLLALPVPELAAEILPAFGPDGPGKDEKEIGALQVGMFLMADFPRGNQYIRPLVEPIKEGIQALENAGLVIRRVRNIGGSVVSVTRLGVEAIEAGTAREHLDGPARRLTHG
jgi:hypothetical protein